MKPMREMDTADFSKAQRKLVKKISALTPYEVIKSILEFYNCPAECGAACCKLDDIPLILDDKKRISSRGIGYRKIVKERTVLKQVLIEGESVTEEVFKDHPCPFLNNDRCSIHKFNPKICSLYPFKTTGKTATLLELVACRSGADIILDFAGFELFMYMMSPSSKSEMPQRLSEAVTIANTINAVGTDDLTKALVYGINDFEKLRFFLLYLNNESKEAVAARREELKNIAANNTVGC